MYKISLCSILFIVLINNAVQAQKFSVEVNYCNTKAGAIDKSLIYYDTANKITWKDFEATPDNSAGFAALTTSGILMDMGFHSTRQYATMQINVYCTFTKPQSWVKKDKENDYILTHEKHHFDLTYIYTQIFVQRLKAAHFTTKNYQEIIKKIYGEVVQELGDAQTKYDDETQHSLIVPKQLEWNKKIDAAINKLNIPTTTP